MMPPLGEVYSEDHVFAIGAEVVDVAGHGQTVEAASETDPGRANTADVVDAGLLPLGQPVGVIERVSPCRGSGPAYSNQGSL